MRKHALLTCSQRLLSVPRRHLNLPVSDASAGTIILLRVRREKKKNSRAGKGSSFQFSSRNHRVQIRTLLISPQIRRCFNRARKRRNIRHKKILSRRRKCSSRSTHTSLLRYALREEKLTAGKVSN